MDIHHIEHPCWNRKICLRPWLDIFCDSKSVASCCRNTHLYSVKYNEHFDESGPYGNNLSFWNSTPFVKLREKMLKGGSELACPNVFCELNVKPYYTMLHSAKELGVTIKQENFDRAVRSIFGEQTKLPYGPARSIMFITDSCDADCAYCFQNLRRSKGQRIPKIPPARQDTMIDFLNNRDSICLVGGEVLSLPTKTLDKYMGSISGQTSVRIMTNGNLLTLEKYERLCVNGPVTEILVSVNTASSTEYRNNKIAENIRSSEKNLRDIYEKYPKNSIHFLTVVVTTSVIPHLSSIVEMASRYKISHIRFFILLPIAILERELYEEDMCGRGYNEEVYQMYKKHSVIAKEKAKELKVHISGLENIDSAMEKKHNEFNES